MGVSAYVSTRNLQQSGPLRLGRLVLLSLLSITMITFWDFGEYTFKFSGQDTLQSLSRNKNCEGVGKLSELTLKNGKFLDGNGVALISVKQVDKTKVELTILSTGVTVIGELTYNAAAVGLITKVPFLGYRICDL
jgi:hypothetical protein